MNTKVKLDEKKLNDEGRSEWAEMMLGLIKVAAVVDESEEAAHQMLQSIFDQLYRKYNSQNE